MTDSCTAFQLTVVGIRDGVLTLRVTGALDYDTSDSFTQQTTQALDGHFSTRLLRLDCAGLSGFDSMGLSTLLALRRRLDGADVALHLTACSPRVERLLTITGTYDYFIGETPSALTGQRSVGAESESVHREEVPPRRGG